MKITTVGYSELRSVNYNNRSIEAVAQVDEGETPEQARELLKLWVQAQFNQDELGDATVQTLNAEVAFLKTQVTSRRAEMADVQAQWNRVGEFAHRHGLVLGIPVGDLPW